MCYTDGTPSAALTRAGYDPNTTPVDTLMAAPVSVHLAVAEAMEDDGNYPDDEGTRDGIPEGFQEWDPENDRIDVC